MDAKSPLELLGPLAKLSALALLLITSISSYATLTTIPDSALSNSPGVYTGDGYYTDTLGPNVVTTGGGNAANIGDPSGRNDDGYMALNLGFNVTFFGTTYSSLYINTNGNVSFGSGISAYIPTGPTGASSPVISPFFGDVDTRNPNSGVVHYNLTTPNEITVTWDQVGYYDSVAPPTDSFQLVLRGDNFVVPTGEGKIGFFYGPMNWSVTDTSQVAAVGFGDGSGNGEVLQGSLDPNMNNVVNNKYIWFDASLAPVPPSNNNVPEPATLALLAAGLVSALMVSRMKRKTQVPSLDYANRTI